MIAEYLLYKARLIYVTCSCNVYGWILGFYSAILKALSTPLQCVMIIVLLKSAFLFFCTNEW